MKTTRLLTLPAVLAALVALGGCSKSAEDAKPDETRISGKPSDPPAELKAAWRPGWTYQFFVQSQQNADIGFGGRMRGGGGGGAGGGNESGMETTFKQDLSVTVTNGPKDGLNLEMELQSLGVTVFVGSETVLHYDSAQQTVSGQAEQLAPVLDKLVGGHFTCLLDDHGKLSSVEGLRELLEESTAAGGDPGNAAGGGAADRRGGGRRGGMFGMMGNAMLQRALNDAFFRPLVEFPGAPEGPVRIGQSWTNQQDTTALMVANITLLTTNTFRGWQYRDGHKCARIEVTGTILQAKQRNGGAGAGGGGMDFLRLLGDLSFDDPQITGTLWLDPQLQIPVEVAMSQSFKISGTMPNWAAGAMGGPGGRPGRGNNPAAAAAAANAMGAGEKFSRPVSMTMAIKLRSATGQ